MSFQFIRDEAFSASPISREGSVKRWSLDSIVAESMRDTSHPGALRHVIDRMRDPIQLTAKSPADVAQEAKDLAAVSLEPSTGKRLRSTANICVSRVMSYPVPCDGFGISRDEVEAQLRAGLKGETPKNPAVKKALAWVVASVKWSRGDLGDLGSVVVHTDESNIHAHHLVPLRRTRSGTAASLSFWRPERAASELRAAARAEGRKVPGREVFAVGKSARREIAADYHAAVGARFGHELKSSEPRARRPYREHRALSESDRLAAVDAAEAARAEAKKERERADRAEAEVRSMRSSLAAATEEIARLRDAGRQAIARAGAWIAGLRGDVRARELLAQPAPESIRQLDRKLFGEDAPALDCGQRKLGLAQ